MAVTTGFYSFCGTFDGQGHTIANFYQNTWEMKGDNNYYDATLQYYRDGMGLFGKIYGGTVKNLTVSNFSSDGEYTTTGCIAAYADGATFQNIAITNCNPRVYNIGNGGIVGCVGWYAKEAGLKTTFANITVDKTNKISALWGSYDVACGGIVGQYYPTSGQSASGNPANGGIHFGNCNMAAQMDVYNDVCGNYQYYAYRYAGMMIGSIRENETIDGNVYPKMDGITASECTVHFGTWNDYYYCEFEKNGHPSYSGPDDYKFSRVPHSELNFTDTDGNGIINTEEERKSVTGCKHNHTDAEDNQAIYLPFNNLVTGYGWGVTTKVVGELEGVTILDRMVADSVEKFETKFTGDFLYRVGNQNTVSLGSLFAAKEDVTINSSGVVVTVENYEEGATVGGTFTPNTKDWTKGTIKFTGTGLVKLTIQDYDYCAPTELIVEVVDAVNATTATSAKSNNVVLLNDMGLHTIEVSGGYTLYGNGFKMTAASDVMYDAMGVGFVTLKNGTLDNVQIICPNFSYAIIYTNQIKNAENTAIPSDSTNDARGNVRSAVMADGNSKIVNSYIHGGRAAVFLRSGNLLIDGATISGGAAANIHAVSAQSLILRNVTLIQKPFKATVHDTTKTIMGFSGLFECDENGNSTPLTLEGTLFQDAWINESYKQYTPSAGQSLVSTALGKTDFLHDLDGDGKNESLNLGFTYIPQENKGNASANVTDNRVNKDTVPYEAIDVGNVVASAQVYSRKRTNEISGDLTLGEDYTFVPDTQGVTAPTISFSDTNEDRVFETVFDTSDNRWESTLTVNLDNGNYNFSFANLLAQKHGANLTYTVKTADGTAVDTSKTVALTASGVTEYVLTITDGDVTHTAYFILIATKTSIPEPVKTAEPNGTHYLVVKSKNSDWSCAINALDGAQIEYYDGNGKKHTLNLSALVTTSDKGKLNGTSNFWTKTQDGYTLKVTCGYIHDTKQIYGMPVAVKGKLYFTISSTNGYVSTSTSGRTVTLTYEFTDPNGKTLTFSKTTQFNYADYKSGTQYSYSDFVKGDLKAASSCVTPDTLVTLADGTQKRIDQVTYEDQLLVWNFYDGEYAVVPAALIQNHGYDWNNIIKLTFSDGTVTKAINEHGYFDATLNEFVMITADNASNFIGHEFVQAEGDAYTTVTLVKAESSVEYIEAYSILTAYYYNFITDDMFSLTSPVIETNFFMPFQVGENMTFDAEKMAADIEKYGLYAYADFEGKIPYEAFEALNIRYLKVAVGKGLITYDQIIELLVSEGVIE